MKIRILNLILIGSIVSSVMLSSCSKDEDNSPSEQTGVFTDSRDGHVYKWVKIDGLTWMAENLAYKPSSGSGYIAYDNDKNNVSTYGYLYQQETAKAVVPDGWRLPTKDEFRNLVNSLGGDTPAYNELLEAGTVHWENPNNATNKSGFTALPGGRYNPDDSSFWGLGKLAVFVSSSLYPNSTTSVMVLNLNRNFLEASVEGNPLAFYYSVRCVKD